MEGESSRRAALTVVLLLGVALALALTPYATGLLANPVLRA
jgi:hypothetical protein